MTCVETHDEAAQTALPSRATARFTADGIIKDQLSKHGGFPCAFPPCVTTPLSKWPSAICAPDSAGCRARSMCCPHCAGPLTTPTLKADTKKQRVDEDDDEPFDEEAAWRTPRQR
ncbi:hypothetical protein GCM10011381_32070 [Klenkia taihuensis]|nr:hypothetical protein GCM10011381_32070 [Klenkia taihuensis]